MFILRLLEIHISLYHIFIYAYIYIHMYIHMYTYTFFILFGVGFEKIKPLVASLVASPVVGFGSAFCIVLWSGIWLTCNFKAVVGIAGLVVSRIEFLVPDSGLVQPWPLGSLRK